MKTHSVEMVFLVFLTYVKKINLKNCTSDDFFNQIVVNQDQIKKILTRSHLWRRKHTGWATTSELLVVGDGKGGGVALWTESRPQLRGELPMNFCCPAETFSYNDTGFSDVG